MRFVYVSGPLSKGDRAENVRVAVAAADRLFRAGYCPYIPHLTVHWDELHPHPYEDWMELDLSWITRCDALIRLPGESPGADREVRFAQQLGIPVFYCIEELLAA